jgi:hypothetical protein
MNVIFSRKGFDAKYGGMASPILPDGRLIPLCIPSSHDTTTLANFSYVDADVAQIIADVSAERHNLSTRIHLDPDLARTSAVHLPGWRPALGQTGAAQGHLRRRAVGRGDVFLFFGWFRLTEQVAGKWRFARGAPDLHVLFGWIEVDEVLPIVTAREVALARHPWIVRHPHVASPARYDSKLNTLYIGRERSAYHPREIPGGGRFPTMSTALQLTKANCSRSIWTLPPWFSPKGRPPLSYHPKPLSWQDGEDSVTLRSAATGQEFVLDSQHYPELEAWVVKLIRENA